MKPLRRWMNAWRQRRVSQTVHRGTRSLTPQQRRNRRILIGTAAAGGVGLAVLSFFGLRPRVNPQVVRPPISVQPSEPQRPVVLEVSRSPVERVRVPRLPGESEQEYQQRLVRERTRNGERPNQNGPRTGPEPYRQRAPTVKPVYEMEEALRYIAREKGELLARTDLANPAWTPQSGGSLAENIPPEGGLVRVQITYNDPLTQQSVTKQSFLFVENSAQGVKVDQFGPLTNEPQFQIDKSLGWKAMSGSLDYWMQQNQGVSPQVLGLYVPK